jgi:hypothetical protein
MLVIVHANKLHDEERLAKKGIKRLRKLYRKNIVELSDCTNKGFLDNHYVEKTGEFFIDYDDKDFEKFVKKYLKNGYVKHKGGLFFSDDGKLFYKQAVKACESDDYFVLSGGYLIWCLKRTLVNIVRVNKNQVVNFNLVGDSIFERINKDEKFLMKSINLSRLKQILYLYFMFVDNNSMPVSIKEMNDCLSFEYQLSLKHDNKKVFINYAPTAEELTSLLE